MISFRPALRAAGISADDLIDVAEERWQIHPKESSYIRPATFLPGQLDRIRATEFLSHEEVVQAFNGNFDKPQAPTYGYLLKDVDLIDGVLYTARGIRHLRQRTRRLPAYVVPRDVESGVLYESWWGNRWFANWLSDDCPRYLLAQTYGAPFTTRVAPSGHVPDYEQRLGMQPRRLDRARFRELIMFEDFTNNTERRARVEAVREKLIEDETYGPHPGVFLLRGTTGDARLLANEAEIAERFATERGFQIFAPEQTSTQDLIKACAGAKVIAGVEGSQLAHGMAVMANDAILFTIQPPDRVTSVLKFFTDRHGMGYAFVIASGSVENFTADWDEISQTLDQALE
ncbi:glycosyltransferase family 61 protein [Ruegeria sp. R13_0]|uniref:glycosyltransferase 61 family protein n=1 Tax=Ruegeria sp. R13_0 TaxID=2821099 RepID=UPI001AD9EE1B|nr:glycosyltransferase family 61 protein [Ruegeria sp. R13_0]MBO9436777.1 glycosyltransferase family 61 protein [Ruegeria sp. R13_0]